MNDAARLRLDIWLWRARFFRTRALAAGHIRQDGVHLSARGLARRTDRPAVTIGIGDVVTFAKEGHILSVEVLGLGLRRGPAEEARLLYRPLETDA